MQARENKIIELLSMPRTQFQIPVYQRDYNWEEKQCNLLFENIIELSKNENLISHFIGSIVYIHEGIYTAVDKKFNIIDGQQRLTTLTILLLAIYHKAKELNDKDNSDLIFESYIIDKFIKSDCKFKLILPEENFELLKKLAEGKFDELEEFKDRNIIKNYNLFYKKVKNFNIDDIESILHGIEKLIYVDIALEKGKDDPQKIFESLNSTGLDLSQADLIRNYILMDLENDEQNRIYKEIWIPIENNCKISNGEEIINFVSDFIRDYLTIKNNRISVKNKVFEDFKQFYNKKEANKNLILNEIKEFSKFYSLIINPEKEKDEQIKKQLGYLKIIDQTVINPFLISILKDYKNNLITKEILVKIMELLQSYLWRRYIVGEPSNALNKVFMTLYSKIDKENYYESFEKIIVNQKFPDDEELKSELKIKPIYKDREKTQYLFERLENSYHNELIDFNNKKITIEHIFPQKPSKEWENFLSKEEIEKMKSLKDTVSNLTLTGSNQNLNNKYFLEKRDEENYGYKDSKLHINSWLGKQDEWNIIKMEERFEILFNDIIKIWNKPKIKINKDLSTIIFSIKGEKSFARGILLKDNKFKVLKDSTAVKIFNKFVKNKNDKILEKLKTENLLKESEENYIFKEDVIFSSPSGAAEFILGYSTNGWREWKTFEGNRMNEFKEE